MTEAIAGRGRDVANVGHSINVGHGGSYGSGRQDRPKPAKCGRQGRTEIELTVSAGILDPGHPRTKAIRDPLRRSLEAIDLSNCRSPSAAAWAEAGMLSGILGRTQLGLAKPWKNLSAAEMCCQEGRRRKVLNDALIFLTAGEQGAILLSSNIVEMDLLSRFRPDIGMLLFRQTVPVPESIG